MQPTYHELRANRRNFKQHYRTFYVRMQKNQQYYWGGGSEERLKMKVNSRAMKRLYSKLMGSCKYRFHPADQCVLSLLMFAHFSLRLHAMRLRVRFKDQAVK